MELNKMKNTTKKGCTLIELVIAVIAIVLGEGEYYQDPTNTFCIFGSHLVFTGDRVQTR